MYFSVTKLVFDPDSIASYEERDMKALCEKIRKRFKVTVSHHQMNLAIVNLAPNERGIERTIDEIASFCEESGFGRIEDEVSIVEPFDVLDSEGLEELD